MEYTPGPWEVNSKRYLEAFDEQHGQSTFRVLIARIEKHRLGSADRIPPDNIQNANARRIVACVNACEGITTENLESFLEDVASNTSPEQEITASSETGKFIGINRQYD